jgi:hypothetical protein
LYAHVPREGKENAELKEEKLLSRSNEWSVQTTLTVIISGNSEHRIACSHCFLAKDIPNMY